MTATIGETSLQTLLSTLTTTLHPSIFAFLTFSSLRPPAPTLLSDALMTFREAEGSTLITSLKSAQEHSITDYQFPCRMITCNVHSSLDAVGFMAVITSRLTQLGIGVNPVSAFYHDHLFVPVGSEDAVVKALEGIASEARAKVQKAANETAYL